MLRLSEMVFAQLVARLDEVQLRATLFDTIALRQIRRDVNKFLLLVFVHIGNGSFGFAGTHNCIAYFYADNSSSLEFNSFCKKNVLNWLTALVYQGI